MYHLELNDETNNWDILDSNNKVVVEDIYSDYDADKILEEYNNS